MAQFFLERGVIQALWSCYILRSRSFLTHLTHNRRYRGSVLLRGPERCGTVVLW